MNISSTTPQNLLKTVLRSAKSGNFKPLVNLLTQYKTSINFTDLVYKISGDSILHVAAAIGTPTDILLILNHFNNSALINIKNKDDKTPLHEACQFSRLDNVNILLEHGADVNAIKRADWTPLMLACAKTQQTSVEIVNLLLKNGALVNLVNKDGWNALHLVARDGNVAVFRVLVQSGSDINRATKNGRIALHIAALHSNIEIINDILTMKPESVKVKDNCGNTALHEAVLGGNIEICKLLIRRGGKINDKNLVNYDLLHLAASVGSLEMIRYLIDEVHCNVNSIARNGLTPLHCAARKGCKDAYELLVSYGADENFKDSFGRSSTDYLCDKNTL